MTRWASPGFSGIIRVTIEVGRGKQVFRRSGSFLSREFSGVKNLAMDWRPRMERTLFCLLVSMTAGALILHFSQPNRPAAGRPGTELMSRTQAWHAVHISPQPDVPTSASTSSHFFINQQGQTYPTDSWIAHRALGQPGVLQIGLQTPIDSREISPEQWAAAMDLIRFLKDNFRIAIQDRDILIDNALTLPRARSCGPSDIGLGLYATAWVR